MQLDSFIADFCSQHDTNRPRVEAEDYWKVAGMPMHSGQLEAFRATERIILLLWGAQSGKALDLDTPIATPSGFKRMGDLVDGDLVYGADGKPTEVITAHPKYLANECFLVTFDDGTEIIADGEHQWFARSRCDRKLGKPGKVVTTKEMSKAVKVRNGRVANWAMPFPAPVEFPERELPIDPYCLGAWLGDGHSRGPMITVEEPEIIDRFIASGFPCTQSSNQSAGKATTYRIGTLERRQSALAYDFHWLLKSCDLICNKHIPEAYKIASVEQRIELLKGLMDTDGYCDPDGHMEFCSVKEQLAMDVAEIVRSLGIKCRVKVARSAIYGKDCGLRYRVHFYSGTPVFNLERKAKRQRTPTRPDVTMRFVHRIQQIESRPVRCITVAATDSLYVAGRDYCVTHNTTFGARWLLREIVRTAVADEESNDYLLAGPTIELLKKKAIPELDRLLKPYAVYNQTDRMWRFTEEGSRLLLGFQAEIKVFVGYATKPDSLESATYKACWADEAGQGDFKEESYEAIMRRLSIYEGRLIITTTPYNFGWLKRRIYDQRDHKNIRHIPFMSCDNPSFPAEEWERAKEEYGENNWRFELFYKGEFSRPVGMVYDCYDGKCEVDAFKVPNGWPLWMGVDFGLVNTSVVILAEELKKGAWGEWTDPTGVFYVVGAYLSDGSQSARDHVKAVRGLVELVYEGTPPVPRAYGGSHQESGWRESWTLAGMGVAEPPINDVRSQIQAVWTAFNTNKLKVFKGLSRLTDEIYGFSYDLDDVTGQPIVDKFQDEARYHRLAALRYVCARLFRSQEQRGGGPSIGYGMKATGAEYANSYL